MSDVTRSKGGRGHLRLLYKKRFPFLWNMPRKMCVFLFKLVPGVQYLAPTTGRQLLRSKKELFVQGAASLAVPQLKVPESRCLLKAAETCFQLLIKCNNSFAT